MNKPKNVVAQIIKANSQTEDISIARMKSPSGWKEPGQTPEFDVYILVLKGFLRISTNNKAVEPVIVTRKQWIQYSTPRMDSSLCSSFFS